MTGATGKFPKKRRAMTEERAVREQLAEFAPIVGTLIAMIKAEHEAFIPAKRFLAQLINRQEPFCREIGSAMRKMNEPVAGKSGGERALSPAP
jgi:hypothetical protein